ncbi:MAG TPA: hypothetical protein VN428_02310 [Bryobacteraceae bacterium]|nr:hypothetical protein [Bryobacteraceae bacterium]
MSFTAAELQAAREMLAANPRAGRETLARILDCTTKRARNILKAVRANDGPDLDSGSGNSAAQDSGRADGKARSVESDEVCGDKRTITRETHERIKTLDDLIRVCEIDTDEWEVEKWIANKWEVGAKDAAKRIQVEPLFQVKAWLKRKVAVVFAQNEINALREKAKGYAPRYPAIIFRGLRQSGNLIECAIYDPHFGKLAWAKETGWADYDTDIAKATFEAALTALLSRTKNYGAERILLTLGNDLQNTDNREGTTTRGTLQSTDSRYQKVFSVTRDVAIWAVEACREAAPDVLVSMVYGNHDFLSTWHLGDSLRSWFRNCSGVTIDNDPLYRKYYQHGSVMLMLTHGNAGKLEEYPQVMAAEQPQMWGATAWREAHTGDKHHRRLVELKGATVRILPSLCPPDAWHSESCFVGNIRAAEAYVWNRDEALIGTAVYSVPGKAALPA